MPDDSVARPRASVDADAARAEWRDVPGGLSSVVGAAYGASEAMADFHRSIADAERSRQRARERDRALIAEAVIAYLVRGGFVVRDPGPLDPNRPRIGFHSTSAPKPEE